MELLRCIDDGMHLRARVGAVYRCKKSPGTYGGVYWVLVDIATGDQFNIRETTLQNRKLLVPLTELEYFVNMTEALDDEDRTDG